MIKLKLLLEGKYEYGCIMATIGDDISKKIIDFGYSLIDEKSLYKDGDSKGRDTHPHITILYGLTESYTEKEMREILKAIRPFKIKITGISLFENEDFDVIKLDVKSKELDKLNEKFSKLPNENEYDEYKPHITLAYVKKGLGKKFLKKKHKFSNVEINTIEYSDKGDKTYYNL